jgi:hypothetical protein
MKELKNRFNNLKNKLEYLDVFSKNDEVSTALLELEKEISKLSEIEIFKEDFSEVSWSYVTKQSQSKSVKVLTCIENEL